MTVGIILLLAVLAFIIWVSYDTYKMRQKIINDIKKTKKTIKIENNNEE